MEKDNAEAVRWFRLAAEQGDTGGQSGLAHAYLKGSGVPKDNVYAYMWFHIAAAQGDKTSEIRRDTVALKMTPDQIAEAQRMAREWMARHQQ